MSLSQKWIKLLDAAGSVPVPAAAIAAATLADAITVTPAVAAPALLAAAPADGFAADTASVTASAAATALEDAPTATVPPNKMRSDGWSPEEVTRLRDALRGLAESSICSTSTGFWLQIAIVGGLQWSPEALHQRWLSTRGPGRRPHTTAIATATLAGAAGAAIHVDAAAFVTAYFAASALEDAPIATVPRNKMRSDGWSPEEVSWLREAMRGLDKSSIRISSNEFWAQLTRKSGFQQSPQALFRRWQIICDEDGARPMKGSRFSPEEDTQLRAAMLEVDESTARSSNMEFWAQLVRETGMQRSPQALYTRWLKIRDVAGPVQAKRTRWTPEEDTRLREALLGVDESTVGLSNTKLWAKVANESGLRRSRSALYRQWLSFRDVAGPVQTRPRWTSEEDTRLREALLGVDESTVRMSNTKLWAKVASENGLRRSPTALYRQWLSFRDAAGSTPIPVTAIAAAALGDITAATPTTVNAAAAASLADAALADASAPTTATAAAATTPLADVDAAAVATATAAAPAFLVDSALRDAPVTITVSAGASIVRRPRRHQPVKEPALG